jgi:Luciferase
MTDLRTRLVTELEKIEGLTDQPSPVSGGSALFFNSREFAHFHNDRELDLRLTKKVIKSEGLTHPVNSEYHPERGAGSHWIEIRFNKFSELMHAVEMVKLAINEL